MIVPAHTAIAIAITASGHVNSVLCSNGSRRSEFVTFLSFLINNTFDICMREM